MSSVIEIIDSAALRVEVVRLLSTGLTHVLGSNKAASLDEITLRVDGELEQFLLSNARVDEYAVRATLCPVRGGNVFHVRFMNGMITVSRTHLSM